MATSSIFASFDIKDKETATRFINALEESANDPPYEPISPVEPPITDKEELLALLAKRETA